MKLIKDLEIEYGDSVYLVRHDFYGDVKVLEYVMVGGDMDMIELRTKTEKFCFYKAIRRSVVNMHRRSSFSTEAYCTADELEYFKSKHGRI